MKMVVIIEIIVELDSHLLVDLATNKLQMVIKMLDKEIVKVKRMLVTKITVMVEIVSILTIDLI
jgi:hypothetical protein